ncbi:hypothetical protein [Myxosarcina sp. GI1(2024)]
MTSDKTIKIKASELNKYKEYAKELLDLKIKDLKIKLKYKFDEQKSLKNFNYKADKELWLIERECEKLNYNIAKLDDKQKIEIGFLINCDYLRYLHKEIKELQDFIGDDTIILNGSQDCQYLELFGKPTTKEELKTGFSNLKVKLRQGFNPNLSRERHQEINDGIQMAKELYEILLKDWNIHINPFDLGIDNRKYLGIELKSHILIETLGKSEPGDKTKVSALPPAWNINHTPQNTSQFSQENGVVKSAISTINQKEKTLVKK